MNARLDEDKAVTGSIFLHVRTYTVFSFLPRDALQCKARSCDCSVCPSVRPSVTLVDQDHIGWKSWKLIAGTISPISSLFMAQRSSTYSQGNVEKFWED